MMGQRLMGVPHLIPRLVELVSPLHLRTRDGVETDQPVPSMRHGPTPKLKAEPVRYESSLRA